MAFAHVVSLAECLGQNGGTSSGINTSGADILFLVAMCDITTAPTVSDSNSNTWTEIRNHDNGFGRVIRLYRSAAGSTVVGSGHTFTVSLTNGVIGFAVSAFSGAASSSIDDQENSNGAIFSSTLAPGSITPSENDTVVITGVGCSDSGSDPSSINGSFTIGAHVASDAGATGFGCGIAYLIQTTAAAANPTWTISQSATHLAAAIANFKAAAGGGGSTVPVKMHDYRRRRAA